MAAPIYDTDLVDINLAEATTGWNDVNQAGGGGALSAEVDYAIQGSFAITRAISNTRRGVMYDTGSAITFGSDEHVFTWTVSATPGLTDIKSSGGIQIIMGSGISNYYGWYVNGSDTLPGGGMNNYAVYPTGSTSNLTIGSPTNFQFFGSQVLITATAKGENFACDAIRRGTGFYITEGDVTTPITFSGSAAINDNNNNRYGIITNVPGGYSLKGRYVVGQDPNQNPTASYFSDSNTAVTFEDTEFSLSDFTQIIFDDSGTIFDLDSVNFTAIGTNNKGIIKVNNSLTSGSITSCNFNNIGNTFLNANVDTTEVTWRSCDTIYQSGSTINGGNIVTTIGATSSLVSDDPSLISNVNFVGNGTKHGIEVVVTGSYNFAGNTFSGFISGSNGGEELLFNPPGGTGDLTINVTSGGNTPSFRNLSSGTVTINNNINVTLTGMKDFTEVRVYSAGTTTELAGIENVVSASVGANDNDFSFSQGEGVNIDIVIISLLFENQRIENFTIPSSDSEIPIQQSTDRNYLNP